MFTRLWLFQAGFQNGSGGSWLDPSKSCIGTESPPFSSLVLDKLNPLNLQC